MMNDEQFVKLAERAAEKLQGSVNSIEGLGPEFEGAENNTAFCAKLDELVFCCVRCGWWCEQSEMSENAADEWFCVECEGGDDD